MTEQNEDAKVAKKAAKAELKRRKKLGKTNDVLRTGIPSDTTSTGQMGAGEQPAEASHPTAAERSAAAAERQVRLQRLRVAIAFATGFIALATLLVALKPWKWWPGLQGPPEPAKPASTETP